MGRKPRRESPLETAAASQLEAVSAPAIEVESPAIPEPDDLPLTFESPESKSIAWATYDPDTRVLVINFSGSGGARYAYDGITLDQWREFYQADSKGAH